MCICIVSIHYYWAAAAYLLSLSSSSLSSSSRADGSPLSSLSSVSGKSISQAATGLLTFFFFGPNIDWPATVT